MGIVLVERCPDCNALIGAGMLYEHQQKACTAKPRSNTTETRSLDRELLRRAGEHLGTLAERAHESYLLRRGGGFTRNPQNHLYQRFTSLARLSREVLEIANG